MAYSLWRFDWRNSIQLTETKHIDFLENHSADLRAIEGSTANPFAAGMVRKSIKRLMSPSVPTPPSGAPKTVVGTLRLAKASAHTL